MTDKIDTNRVELSGRIATEPIMRIVPPGSTFYMLFGLTSRGEWPDHTGTAVLLEYRHLCFAQGSAAESIAWASEGDSVLLVGAIDLILDDYAGPEQVPCYKPAIRVQQMQLIEEGEPQ